MNAHLRSLANSIYNYFKVKSPPSLAIRLVYRHMLTVDLFLRIIHPILKSFSKFPEVSIYWSLCAFSPKWNIKGDENLGEKKKCPFWEISVLSNWNLYHILPLSERIFKKSVCESTGINCSVDLCRHLECKRERRSSCPTQILSITWMRRLTYYRSTCSERRTWAPFYSLSSFD